LRKLAIPSDSFNLTRLFLPSRSLAGFFRGGERRARLSRRLQPARPHRGLRAGREGFSFEVPSDNRNLKPKRIVRNRQSEDSCQVLDIITLFHVRIARQISLSARRMIAIYVWSLSVGAPLAHGPLTWV
jgi:hypothetical protein